MNSFFF